MKFPLLKKLKINNDIIKILIQSLIFNYFLINKIKCFLNFRSKLINN